MPATKRTPDELARLGREIFERQVSSALAPPDDGKFIAIDVDSHDYEVNEDDHAAIMALRARRPAADIWLMRAGFPTTCRNGAAQ
jgi:hypothetical protein